MGLFEINYVVFFVVNSTVHGDDFLVVADEEQLHWLNKKMQEEYEDCRGRRFLRKMSAELKRDL